MGIKDLICPDGFTPTHQFVSGLALAAFSYSFFVVTWFTVAGYVVWELLFIWATWDRPWAYSGLARGALIVSIAALLLLMMKLRGRQ